MEKDLKDILLKDLCARLPYGVKVQVAPVPSKEYEHITFNAKIVYIDINYIGVLSDWNFVFQQDITEVKPYLYPLSSMSEEQKEELITITNGKLRYMCGDITNAIPRKNSGECGISENAYIHDIKVINILYIWLLKNHFDINGLIPMGLANDATGLNIY